MKTCLNCNSENPDDARYCSRCRFTLDWSTTATDDPTRVLPPAVGPPLEVAMGPPEVRVRPGGSAVFQARVANRGDASSRALLQLVGAAAPYATVQPGQLDLAPGATGAATVTISVPPGTPAQQIPISLSVVQARETQASVAARATLVIEAAPVARFGPSRTLVVVLAGLAGLALVIMVLAFVDGGGDGDGGGQGDGGGDVSGSGEGEGGSEGEGEGEGEGTVTGRVVLPGALCVHSEPNLDRSSRVATDSGCLSIPEGREFEVRCVADGLLQLEAPEEVADHWITSEEKYVELDEAPPGC